MSPGRTRALDLDHRGRQRASAGHARNLAHLYPRRDAPGDHELATALLGQALADATAKQLPEADDIRALMQQHGIAP